jgi:hypothetical protein
MGGRAMIYISLADYFGPWAGHPDLTPARQDAAIDLCNRVNALLAEMETCGIRARGNPKTGTLVSGETGGGFRPQDYPVGAKGSAHKEGQAIDLFDPFGSIGGYLYVRQNLLVRHKLWMEHPSATTGWCHVQSRGVKSGNTVFFP